MAAYEPSIMPINGRGEWGRVDAIPPLPPKAVRRVGRPPKARRQEPDEPQQKHVGRRGRPINRDANHQKRNQTTIKCGVCGISGHNRKSCPFDVSGENEEETANLKRILQECGLEDIDDEDLIEQLFNDNSNNTNEDNNVDIVTQEPLASELTQVNVEYNHTALRDKKKLESLSAIPSKLQPRRKSGIGRTSTSKETVPTTSDPPVHVTSTFEGLETLTDIPILETHNLDDMDRATFTEYYNSEDNYLTEETNQLQNIHLSSMKELASGSGIPLGADGPAACRIM